MTCKNWIAFALMASFAAASACSPQGGQAGQPDQPLEQSDRPDTGVKKTGITAEWPDSAAGTTIAPAAANLVALTVPAGTQLHMVIDDELSSRKNKPGDTFTAKLDQEVRDAQGRVVLESGTEVNGIVVAVKPAPNRRTPGTLTLALSTIERDAARELGRDTNQNRNRTTTNNPY